MVDLKFGRGRISFKPGEEASIKADLIKTLTQSGASPEEAKSHAERGMGKAKQDILWVSETHQVSITANQVIHYSIKTKDKSPIFDRDDLLDIAGHFNRSRKHVCVELYPANSRLVDAANQYHLWRIDYRKATLIEPIRAALSTPKCKVLCADGVGLIFLPLGAKRDWREVQELKDQIAGSENEAVDLMLPETRGQGPLLLLAPEGQQFGLGFQSGMVSKDSNGNWRQRKFEKEAADVQR